VFIDDIDQLVQTPCTLTNIEPGNYFLTLRKERHNDWDTTIQVIAGKTAIAEAILSEVEYTLTVNTDGRGSVTRYPDKPSYRYADTVELTAVPDSGYKFESWSGDLEGTANPDTIIMYTDRDATAKFVELILMTVTGTVWRADGEPMVNPFVFLDTSSTDTVVIFRSIGWSADTETGDFRIRFETQGLDSLFALVLGYDDINGNRAIDPYEPFGWWDLDSNGTAESPNDYILLHPHETVTGARVVLYPGSYAPRISLVRPEGRFIELR
jgi:hypothetical protein